MVIGYRLAFAWKSRDRWPEVSRMRELGRYHYETPYRQELERSIRIE